MKKHLVAIIALRQQPTAALTGISGEGQARA